MQLPEKLLQSLQQVKGFNEQAFVQVHAQPKQVTSIRFNPFKTSLGTAQELISHPVPWSSQGYYLKERPSFTFDPLFHAGVYYVQEASSMFLEQAFTQTVDVSQPLRVLDLCAAPGGKSTLLQSLINEQSLLVSNEVIKARANILEENMVKWGSSNTVITNNDPAHFARLENYFDVIVVDAPCSGSGLFRRDAQAINEWSENNVALCSQRQQRIIADVWPALKHNGVLIYSTCSYSIAEDEDILDWMVTALQVKSIPLKVQPHWNIVETNSLKQQAFGYRFYPDKLQGEGFFIAAVKKINGEQFATGKTKKAALEKPTKAELLNIQPWLKEGIDMLLFKQQNDIIALPHFFQEDVLTLQSILYIKKAGVRVGKLAGKDIVPDHQLALSTIINENIVVVSLNEQQSIQYLRKEEVQVNTINKGWSLVDYKGHCLGWIKILPNRINNYYPKEWRILKG